ncbi:TIR domain-containing protein [Reichenbachiella sp.]
MKSRNVFISHYGADDEHVQKLKSNLSDRGVSLRNSSRDSTRPNNASNEEYIKSMLRDGINWAGSVVVLIGPDTHSREWVNWEIEYAHKLGKRIIGVFLHGAKDSDVPENLDNYGHGLTGWNMDKVIDGIDGKDIGWCKPDGTPRNPEFRPTNVPKC